MAVGTRSAHGVRGAAIVAIALLVACGSGTGAGPEDRAVPVATPEQDLFDPPSPGSIVPAAGPTDASAPGDPGGVLPEEPVLGPTEQEVARLSSFWAVERFYADGDFLPVLTDTRLARERLAKAEVDECFNGVGELPGTPPCTSGTEKRNQSYVWGLTRTGRTLWFGTIANVLCQVIDAYLGFSGGTPPNGYWVCEGEQNALGLRDFRPPHLYRFDLDAAALTTLDPPAGTAADALRKSTVGFRSAGEANGVVFLAGLSLAGGINVFAFDAATGDLLAAKNLAQFDDIRTWLEVNDVLYAGVANTSPAPGAPAGSILRWIGEKSTDPDVLFRFEVVGLVDNEAANLALHDGRIYTTTWPNGAAPFGLFRSPPIPDGGFTAADASSWEKLWSITDYDPDPVAAMSSAGGALASFGGKLYWGTMHVPFLATTVAQGVLNLDADGDGEVGAAELLATALGSHRSSSLFVLEDGPAGPVVDVLFGETFLPTYDPAQRRYTIAFDAAHQNRAAQVPLRGSSGVGNFFNAYTWSMQVYGDALYIGMFDWTQVARVGAESLLGLPEVPLTAPDQLLAHLGTKLPQEGADLFRIDRDGEVTAESLTGLGNDTNYGVRTMVTDDATLYVGTANPMNLHPDGGWELLRLEPSP